MRNLLGGLGLGEVALQEFGAPNDVLIRVARQPGGASQALRRLVDEARRADGGRTAQRTAQERCYRAMSALAGDYPGFEDAARQLFAGDMAAFGEAVAGWPVDVRTYLVTLARVREDDLA